MNTNGRKFWRIPGSNTPNLTHDYMQFTSGPEKWKQRILGLSGFFHPPLAATVQPKYDNWTVWPANIRINDWLRSRVIWCSNRTGTKAVKQFLKHCNYTNVDFLPHRQEIFSVAFVTERKREGPLSQQLWLVSPPPRLATLLIRYGHSWHMIY